MLTGKAPKRKADKKRKIAALVREINPRKCELLPYHNLGEHKYEVTGVPYMIFETPDEKRIAHLKELLRDF